MREQLVIRWRNRRAYEGATGAVAVARDFTSSHPDRKPGPRHGVIYTGGALRFLVYRTKAGACVVEVWGADDA